VPPPIMQTLVFGKMVLINAKGRDRYRRTKGRVMIGRIDINRRMVERGLSWHYEEYSKQSARAEAQAEAKAAKRVLWIDPAPVAPWEFRKLKKRK
jgi:endonuclease YncB( thermonuclease family)